MALLISKVPRALENKNRMFGFELSDLLIIFLYLSLSNLVFGQTVLKFWVVWLGTLILGAILYFTKKGKPDHFLQHGVQYLLSPSHYSAGVPDLNYEPLAILKSNLKKGKLCHKQ